MYPDKVLGSIIWYKEKRINDRILINYMRDDIAEKKIWINVKMKADKIQVFYIKVLGLGA